MTERATGVFGRAQLLLLSKGKANHTKHDNDPKLNTLNTGLWCSATPNCALHLLHKQRQAARSEASKHTPHKKYKNTIVSFCKTCNCEHTWLQPKIKADFHSDAQLFTIPLIAV